jgi:4-diphosphocytidyl-2-C-methyl-D-erythritol kinase
MRATAALTLHKVLPVASGIGGGSADAAATLRLLARVGGQPEPGADALLGLGADVPACMTGQSVRMAGVGEAITPFAAPRVWAVLANPGVAVSTPAVFRALARRDSPALPAVMPAFDGVEDFAAFLSSQRNDLEAPAMALAPAIAECKSTLAQQDGCLLSRMSGSGATCFGLFADEALARTAAAEVQAAHPGWWVCPTRLG